MVPFLAFSLQDQVEKYGAYIGIAAFFGLAVLTILYFSQARELRRLRDWAGRAPERAQEVEARAVAQAEAARRVQAQPIGTTAAPAAALGAATVAGSRAAQPAQGEQATQVVEGDETGEAAAAQAGNGTAAAAGKVEEGGEPPEGAEGEQADGEKADGETADGAQAEGAQAEGETGEQKDGEQKEGEEAEAAPEAAAGKQADAEQAEEAPGEQADAEQPAAGEPAPDAEQPVAGESEPEGEPAVPAAATAANEGEDSAPAAAKPGEGDEAEAPGPAAAPAEPVQGAPANGETSEPPRPGAAPAAPVPRATPLPRRAPAPAAALRQPSRSTTLPPRRPAPGAPRRAPASANGASHGSRNVLIGVGLGVIVLAAGALYATGVVGGDGEDPAPPPNTTSEPATEQPSPTGTLTPASTKVAVLNGTTIGGLASTSADEIRSAGYKGQVTTGNNTDQQRAESEVLYGARSGARRQAQSIARRLDVATVGRLDADTRNLSEGADVVVILGQDKAP